MRAGLAIALVALTACSSFPERVMPEVGPTETTDMTGDVADVVVEDTGPSDADTGGDTTGLDVPDEGTSDPDIDNIEDVPGDEVAVDPDVGDVLEDVPDSGPPLCDDETIVIEPGDWDSSLGWVMSAGVSLPEKQTFVTLTGHDVSLKLPGDLPDDGFKLAFAMKVNADVTASIRIDDASEVVIRRDESNSPFKVYLRSGGKESAEAFEITSSIGYVIDVRAQGGQLILSVKTGAFPGASGEEIAPGTVTLPHEPGYGGLHFRATSPTLGDFSFGAIQLLVCSPEAVACKPSDCTASTQCREQYCNPLDGCGWRPAPGVPCDDGNVCTADACDDALGCTHVATPAPCPGGQCVGEVCVAGAGNTDGIAAGDTHTCAVRGNGTVWCWGAGDKSKLAPGSKTPSAVPLKVKGINDVLAVDAGPDLACALLTGGEVACWGNLGSWLGGETKDAPVTFDPNAEGALAVGDKHVCAMQTDGDVSCWGDNAMGQLGTGVEGGGASAPPPGEAVKDATSIAAGASHSCAVVAGTVHCWGDNAGKQLAAGKGVSKSAIPIPVEADKGKDLAGMTNVVAAGDRSCAWGPDKAWCWGQGFGGDGKSGDPHDHAHEVKVGMKGFAGVKGMAVGGGDSCLIDNVGAVWCWGGNERAEAGTTAGVPVVTPNPVPLPFAAVNVAVGADHACAHGQDGGVWCWGNNAQGELGRGMTHGPRPAPVPVTTINIPRWVSAGNDMTCAVDADGKVWQWGMTSESVLYGAPTTVPEVPASIACAAGYQFGCALTTLGEVYCWGSKEHDKVLSKDGSAEQIKDLTGIVQIATGNQHVCARSETEVQCWGAGLGLGGPGDDEAPHVVPEFDGVAWIATGGAHTCAVAPGGNVRCAGAGDLGQLGNGVTDSQPVPLEIPDLDAATTVAAGSATTLVLSGGKVLGLGANTAGELGDGKGENQLTPTEALTLKTAWGLTSSGGHACAIQSGLAFCWGQNLSEQLGMDPDADGPGPTPVTLLSGLQQISAGGDHTCAIAGDKLYCWGDNGSGQVGDGTAFTATPQPVVAFP